MAAFGTKLALREPSVPSVNRPFDGQPPDCPETRVEDGFPDKPEWLQEGRLQASP